MTAKNGMNPLRPRVSTVIFFLVAFGVPWATWHINMLFSPIRTFALFAAGAIAVSVLMTVLFLHTRGSVLLAIVLHCGVLPRKYVVNVVFPTAPEPPDWLLAVVVITVAMFVVFAMGRDLSVSAPNYPRAAELVWTASCEVHIPVGPPASIQATVQPRPTIANNVTVTHRTMPISGL